MVAQAHQFHALLFGRRGATAMHGPAAEQCSLLTVHPSCPTTLASIDIHSKPEAREDAVRTISLLFHLHNTEPDVLAQSHLPEQAKGA